MCVCVYVYIYIDNRFMCVCTYLQIHGCGQFVRMCVLLCVKYMCNVCIYMCMCVFIYMNDLDSYVYMNIYTNKNVYVCEYIICLKL